MLKRTKKVMFQIQSQRNDKPFFRESSQFPASLANVLQGLGMVQPQGVVGMRPSLTDRSSDQYNMKTSTHEGSHNEYGVQSTGTKTTFEMYSHCFLKDGESACADFWKPSASAQDCHQPVIVYHAIENGNRSEIQMHQRNVEEDETEEVPMLSVPSVDVSDEKKRPPLFVPDE